MVTPSLVIVGAPHFLSQDHVAALGTEGDGDGVRQFVHAGLEGPPRLFVELQYLRCHSASSLVDAAGRGSRPGPRRFRWGPSGPRYFLTTARTSRAERMRYSSPSTLTS